MHKSYGKKVKGYPSIRYVNFIRELALGILIREFNFCPMVYFKVGHNIRKHQDDPFG